MNQSTSLTEPAFSPLRWRMLAIALCAPFLSIVDFFIVNISIPALQRDLGASYGQIELVIAGYGLAYAVLVITGGRLGDVAGRKRMFVLGMSGFTLASLLCGLAPTAPFLIVARVFQGLTGALMMPQVLSIIQTSFPPAERERAFACFGITIGLGSITGQLMGGLLVGANPFGLGWRSIFLVNLPIGLLALWGAIRWLEESHAQRKVSLDWGGVALASIALTLLLLPLVPLEEQSTLTFSSARAASLSAGTLACIAFFFFERRKFARGGDPLVDPALLRVRSFVIGLFVILSYSGGQASFFMTLTWLLQRAAGLSAIAAARSFLPFAIGLFVASLGSARFAQQRPKRFLYAGMLLMAVGLLILLATASRVALERRLDLAAVAIFVYGFGQGCATPSLYAAILIAVPASAAGSASGVLGTVQQIAASLGVAGIGVIFLDGLGSNTDSASYVRACDHALVANSILIILATVLASFLHSRPRSIDDRLEDRHDQDIYAAA